MKFKLLLFLSSILTLFIFIIISYSVAKENWQQLDFDITVKLQDRIPRHFDQLFSYFSLIGSVEITFGIAIILALFSILKLRFLAFIGWLMIIPATMIEVFGKLVLFHPSPPEFFHRTIISSEFPSFYIHTNFSYPSGHITRTIFLITVFVILSMVVFRKNLLLVFLAVFVLFFIAFMMVMTRIYLGEHWLSDVVGGGFLGLSAGLFAASLIIASKRSNL